MDTDFYLLNHLDLDLSQAPVICTICGVSNCNCGTVDANNTPSSSSALQTTDSSEQTVASWLEHPLSAFERQNLLQQSRFSPPQPLDYFQSAPTAGSTDGPRSQRHQSASVSSARPQLQKSLEPSSPQFCACLRELLLLSEQLDQYKVTKLVSGSLLELCRPVVEACERFMQCQQCDGSLLIILSVAAMRRASICYRQLASESQGAFASGDELTFRCRVGSFEINTELDYETYKEILSTEIARAFRSATNMIRLLDEPVRQKVKLLDDTTLYHHRELIKDVSRELQRSLELLGPKST